MGFGWVQKKVSPIGIDFGSDSLKLLQVSLDDPPQLVAAASRDIPTDARQNTEARMAFLREALRELLRAGGFKGRRVVASIPASHTFVQHLRLNKADALPIDAQIEGELRGRLPVDPSRLVMRHLHVGDVFADGSSLQEVICLAAARDLVMRHVDVLSRCRLDVVGMHCEPVAIVKAFAHLYRRAGDEKQTTFFIDIGAATTKAMITHGTELVFAKTIQVAGDHFNRQLAKARGMEPGEARLVRMQEAAAPRPAAVAPEAEPTPVAADDRRRGGGGMAMLNAALGAEGADGVDAPKARATDDASPNSNGQAESVEHTPAEGEADVPVPDDRDELLDCMADELQLCVGYHASTFPDRPIDKVVFLGGEAKQVDICQHLARALGMPAQIGDALARVVRGNGSGRPVEVDLRQAQPGWAVPLGLCLLPVEK